MTDRFTMINFGIKVEKTMRLAMLLSIVCLPIVVNAGPSTKGKPAAAATRNISIEQFVSYMLEAGDSFTRDVMKDTQALGLPDEPIPGKGDSTDKGELGPTRRSHCDIMLRTEADGKPSPFCIIVTREEKDFEKHEVALNRFVFTPSGQFQRAVRMVGQIDDQGHGVSGSGDVTTLDSGDKTIVKQAKAELDLWMKRAAKAMAKKKTAKN